jgi:hypothetical protein
LPSLTAKFEKFSEVLIQIGIGLYGFKEYHEPIETSILKKWSGTLKKIKSQTFDLGAIFCMILSRVMAAVFADPLRER